MNLRVSDHALVRFLERAAGLDVEGLRARIGASLARSVAAADRMGADDITVIADGLLYVVRNGTVVTVLPDSQEARHRAARPPGGVP